MSNLGKPNKVLENTVFFRLPEHNALNLFFALKKVLRCFFSLFWKKVFNLFLMDNLMIKKDNVCTDKSVFYKISYFHTIHRNDNNNI